MSANTSLLTVEEVAHTLGLHVRTVRRYLREGRLKGFKVGKSYRIAARDLVELTGQPEGIHLAAPTAAVLRRRHIETSILVQVDAIDREGAMRVMNALGGAAKGRDKHSDIPLRVDTVYDETRARLKVMATGSLATATGLLQLMESMSAR
jgi:excisionase family DNA binding protein